MSSLYPQSYYGQPSYSGSSFAPPAHNGYPYQYQQPQQPLIPPAPPVFHHVDPASFRRDYAQRLSQLTFNSRPIIQNLSMLAQEYSRFADIVSQCIEAHIRRVPPWTKLPAFYLLDAISKNVYEPYARHFASFVIPLFLETYAQVDESTRSKMEEMLLTWRTGSPTGKELFGVPPQVAIERGVWGDGNHANNSFYPGSGQITKSQVLSELQFTLGQKERALQVNPYDSLSQNHVTVLQQLRKHVEAGVSQEDLQQILSQLRSLTRSSAPVPPPPVAPPASIQWQSTTSFPPQPPAIPSALAYPALQQQPFSQPEDMSFSSDPVVKREPQSSNIMSTPPASATSVAAPPAKDIANLLSTLLKAGVVSASGTPVGAGATAKEEYPKYDTPESTELNRESSRRYRELILSQNIKLSSSEITRTRPRIVETLYNRLGAQCRQCGIRFADSFMGKKSMDDHLDMHFRQNRKATQNIGRGHSRSWFIGVEDWIHDVSADSKGKGRADGPGRLNAKAAAAAELAKRDAELRSQYVVVPPGDEAKHVSCPICKEILKSEFLEDDEDWVWKNAIMKDDRVYHATCHAEAVASTSSLAARLRTEMNDSRSATPEIHSMPGSGTESRATPPVALRISKSKSPSLSPSSEIKLAGTKRKVEPIDPSAPAEADGTPPLKKIALSTT